MQSVANLKMNVHFVYSLHYNDVMWQSAIWIPCNVCDLVCTKSKLKVIELLIILRKKRKEKGAVKTLPKGSTSYLSDVLPSPIPPSIIPASINPMCERESLVHAG